LERLRHPSGDVLGRFSICITGVALGSEGGAGGL
jgi:hypothetical protein